MTDPMTSNTTNSPQQIAPPWCPWHARRTTCCRCRPDIHVAPSPQSDTREAVALADEIARMRRMADDWRRPNLRQVEGPNDLKIYGGTIADDIDRWAGLLTALRSTPNAGTEMLREVKDKLAEFRCPNCLNTRRVGNIFSEWDCKTCAPVAEALAKIDASQSPTGEQP